MSKKKEKISKLINFDSELYKEIEKYQKDHYYPSFTKTVKELVRIGLGDKIPRD